LRRTGGVFDKEEAMRTRLSIKRRLLLVISAIGLIAPLANSGVARANVALPCTLAGTFHFEPISKGHMVILSLAGDCQSTRYVGQQVHLSLFAVGTATDVGACSGATEIQGLNLLGDYNHTLPNQPTTSTQVRIRRMGNRGAPFPSPTGTKMIVKRASTGTTLGGFQLITRIYGNCPPAGNDQAEGRIVFLNEPGDLNLPI
jgi:hypothetical protein